MKFGKTLLRNQLPEWSKNYISYKTLKKSINEAAGELPPSEEVITAILFQLDRELEKVDTFYSYKKSQVDRRLWILSEKYNQHYNPPEPLSPTPGREPYVDINEELLSALQETRAQMNKVMWFAELNAKGFRKILKKLDKKLGLESQHVYWNTKVSVLPFASQGQIHQEIDKLTQWISTLTLSTSVTDSTHGKAANKGQPASVAVKLPLPSTMRRHNNILNEEENDLFSEAIEDDDLFKLKELLNCGSLAAVKCKSHADQTRYALLELATQRGSIHCLEYLIQSGVSPLDHRDINERNILHKLSILLSDARPEQSPSKVLQTLLQLSPELPKQVDFAGRRPLHYACEFGQSEMAKVLLRHAIEYSYYGDDGFADPRWQDRDGHTPLFLSILHGNFQTLSALVETANITDIDGVIAAASVKHTNGNTGSNDDVPVPEFARQSHHPSAVAMACTLSNLELLYLLIDTGASVDLADEEGETPLLIAIRNQFTEGARVLITQGHANVNLPEKVNGWTPLIIAAMEGCYDIAQILLEHGADMTYTDYAGWAAYEHAVFRGHLDIGKLIKPKDIPRKLASPTHVNGNGTETNGQHILKARSSASRLYGHKYLTDQTMIIIKLGSNDIRNPLSKNFLNLHDNSLEDQRMSIAVSATGATGELPILDLPENNQQYLLQPDPMVLFCSRPEDVVLRFDLVETFASPQASDAIIARGTAIMATDQIYTKSGGFKGQTAGNFSLRGQQTVPLIRTKTLEYVGTIGFEYFVIKPFTHPRMSVGDRYTYYKSVDTKIIGHRGSGMNRKDSHLQVGENTVLSFITAASLGAEYVEFDVQLTKDMVPVIYHDWTVTETGFDIPLNAITVEQFLNLRPSGHIKEYHTGVSNGPHGLLFPTINNTQPEPVYPVTNGNAALSPTGARMGRSNSLGAIGGVQMYGRNVASKRLELTRTNKLGKLKGNGPESIQAPFTTLVEALKKIPKTAGCNIEVKYPMVDEAEGDELYQFQEINMFVDTILSCVYDNTEEDRRIIFSSFHPEICLALNIKQPNYPVFFLSDAGTLPMADVRCNSLQGAMRFAKQADLLGVVLASEPILEAPRMVNVIKESGLLLFTYGVLNNEVENAVAQRNYGVDAVIVDSVVAVRKGLRGGDAPAST
ncbi:GDPD-domain-containing protein [Lichtheimia hyalospora FSU 10163]|nr:GDPD-domain-containing protein [Lichtheimia hyalospora FSU 10163]